MTTQAAVVLMGMLAAVAVAPAQADIDAKHKHLGSASCAASLCHGSSEPRPDTVIMGNEFTVWQELDPHQFASEILKNPQSQRIARNLGIGDPMQADICLDCHGENPPEALRGPKFQVSDGVGCESCHGGSELWIASHTREGGSREEDIANGMYPTENPVARAKLCLSCHMGSKDRMITHEIMGAGHPRLSFELDTFTWLNPHYRIDADYEARNGAFNGARDWGVGQGVAALNLLEQLTDPKVGRTGIFPELVLFDCHACHKKMSGRTWTARASTGLGPGIPRLNDANLLVYRYVVGLVDVAAANRLRDQTRALHQATVNSRDGAVSAANALRATIESTLQAVATHDFNPDSLPQILRTMAADAEKGEFSDFAAAEQAAMAAQSVVIAFTTAKQIDAERSKALLAKVDGVYATVENGDRYGQNNFIAAFKQLSGAATH